MKLRIISSKEEIGSLMPSEKVVHLAFRPSNVDFLNLMQRCPRLQAVQVPPSYQKTMSSAIRVFLDMQGIQLLGGDVWGHRKDINEYFTVPDEVVTTIKSMSEKGANPQDIEREVQRTAKLGSDLIKYIAKAKITA
jgi:hypothetical protein